MTSTTYTASHKNSYLKDNNSLRYWKTVNNMKVV